MNITRLSDRRDARAAARAYHPSAQMPVVRVWDQSDAIATAQDFHTWAAEAERGTLEPARPDAPWYVTQSRARKAKWANRAAVALLLAASVFLGAIAYAASAHADAESRAWVAEYGPAVCDTLSSGHATIAGLTGILIAVADEGYTPEQSGQLVAESVFTVCPRYIPLLRQFVAIYGPRVTA